uniref:Uncharacterized protein n=1 Tax=Rhizophora mucronata TaxID=61149 RepID=A0A2P2NR84_RHIMU
MTFCTTGRMQRTQHQPLWGRQLGQTGPYWRVRAILVTWLFLTTPLLWTITCIQPQLDVHRAFIFMTGKTYSPLGSLSLLLSTLLSTRAL